MSSENVLIVGSSGHAKVIIDIFEKKDNCKIAGLIDSFKTLDENTFEYKILGKEEDLPDILSNTPFCKIFIAIGDNKTRAKVANKIKNILPNIEFISAIHPSAQIGKNVKIGKGVAIMAGAIINSDSIIEDFAIVNTKASIDHDCKMFEFSSLGPNVTTGGNVNIGKFSTIGIGATISNGITVGDNSIIGACSLLLKDCKDNTVMYGFPAKEIRANKK